MNHRAGRRESSRDAFLVKSPEQREPVALLLGRIAERPLGGPVADRPDHRRQGLTRGRKRVTALSAAATDASIDEASTLEHSQSLGKERSTHPGYSSMDLIEAAGANHEFSDDQRRPSIAQDFDPDRDRAVLLVVRHSAMIPARCVGCQYILCTGLRLQPHGQDRCPSDSHSGPSSSPRHRYDISTS